MVAIVTQTVNKQERVAVNKTTDLDYIKPKRQNMGSISRWLDVEVGADEVDLYTLPCNLCLVDLDGDGDVKLVIGDFGRGEEGPKLKVFKGAMQISDTTLPDLPLGVVSFYTNDHSPRSSPVLAVGFSSVVYLYRNMKLFYKYYLPAFEVSTCEMDVWKQLTDPKNHSLSAIAPLIENLKAISRKILSPQSLGFISLTPDQQLEYLEQGAVMPKKIAPEITCIATLKMHSIEKHSVSALVIASEDGDIVILNPHSFNTLTEAKICSVKKTPYQMVATGLHNVDYRITVATREKSVCVLKRDWPEGRILFTCDDHIVAMEVMRADNSVVVICCDNTMSCYSRKGKKQWSLTLEHRPVALTLVPVVSLGASLAAVALVSGRVALYDGKLARDTMFVRDVASVMKFGQLGQEENVFIIITRTGNLMLKILKRTADFSAHAAGVEAGLTSTVGQKPWLIPKKSKLFLEQSVRERENAIAIHESFQNEMSRLRLVAAKGLLEAHLKSDNSIAVGALEPVRLSAEVEGLGPVFRITLIIENTSKDKAVIGLALLFHVHTSNYKVSNPYMKVPLLAPTSKLSFPTKIEEVFEDNINPEIFFRTVTGQGGERTLVKVLLLKEGRTTPVLAATVQMPPTDPMMLPYDKIQKTGIE